jgi:hypothetical protein
LSDYGFHILQGLIFTGFVLLGLLLLLMPQEKYLATVGRFLPVGKPGVAREIQRRVLGVILAVFGGIELASDLSATYTLMTASPSAGPTGSQFRQIGVGWLPLAAGAVLVSAGCFIAFNPQVLVRWSQRRLFPDRQIAENAVRSWSLGLRVMGVLMVASSESLFRLWAGR